MSLKFAVIGCGYWGPNFMRVLSFSQTTQLVSICDMDEQKSSRAKGLFNVPKTTTDYKDIAKDPEIDAVIVSTPTQTHYQIVKDLLKSKKHVLCEKPLTTVSEQALELDRLAKENGCVFMVGHTFEYNSAVQYIKKDILKNGFGKILYIHFTRTGLGPIRTDLNAMWDLAPHDISIMLYLLEEMPVSVTAFGATYLQQSLDDVVFLVLEFKSNYIVKMHLSWLDPCKTRTMTVVGENKMVVFDDVSLHEKIRIYDKGVDYQPKSGEFGDFQLKIRDGGISIPNFEYKEPLKTEVDHFCNCIINSTPPMTGAQSAYKVIRVLEAAQNSLDNNNKKVLL